MDESVVLCVVNELHNEIDRHAEREERDHLHRTAQHYREIHAADGRTRQAYEKLIDILGEPGTNESKKSDRNQLAKAAAGEADVFVTRDRQLLGKATEIEHQLGLKVMTPAELSSTLDEAERAQVFQPARLAGTNLIERAMRAEDVDVIIQTFQASLAGEKQGSCAQLVRQHMAQRRSAKSAQLRVVWGGEKTPLAASIRVTTTDRKCAVVSFLRFSQGGLEKTLCRHLLLALVRENNDDGLDELLINDPHLGSATLDALRELHFEHDAHGWRRMTPAIIGTRQELSKALGDKAEVATLPTAMLEERHWPAKVLGENLPTFILSIKPVWAAQLFDRDLAEEELFGAFAKLALNREQVYYRSARAAGLVFPARILWYVCQGKTTDGGMSVRACSRLQSFETASAKELFRRYQRLGIYSWHEISATTKGDAHADIMAIRFADSEPFPRPVPVEMLRDLGIKSQFQSPTKITEDQFAAIYRFGINR
jgi:predicted nucleic acid-binding protein